MLMGQIYRDPRDGPYMFWWSRRIRSGIWNAQKVTQNPITTTAVFGAGGVSGYFGAMLARAGYPVVFIARGAHLEAIRKNGLAIRSPKGDFHVTPEQVTDNPADIGPVDAVILGVKAWQVLGAAKAMHPLLGPTTKVLRLQNGVEAADHLQQILGLQHTLVSLCRTFSHHRRHHAPFPNNQR